MDVLARITQLYLLLLALIATGTLAWGTNRLVLGNTLGETGWPALVGVAVALLVIGIGFRLWSSSADENRTEDYPL